MTGARWARWRCGVTLLRVLVMALALPLASSGALPFWAQLAGVEGIHVCHCSIEKHDCVCSKCNPDHEEEMLLTTESLTGRCGDDEVAFGGKAICTVLPAAITLTPPSERSVVVAHPADPMTLARSRPPIPPPRSIS